MSTTIFYVENDMVLQLAGLVDRDGVPITNATVRLTELSNCDGDTPSGIALPLALTHTENGTYEAQIDGTLDVEIGEVLVAKITATSVAGNAAWFENVVVRRRAQ